MLNRKLAKFALVLIPLFGVTYICTAAYPRGLNSKADMYYLYWEMFYNSFQVRLAKSVFFYIKKRLTAFANNVYISIV